MNKRGSVTILVGWTMPVILVAGVFAVDAARVWLAKARLQTALDAAALSAARDMNDGNASQRDANARAIAGEQAGQTGAIQIEQTGSNSVKVTGSVTVKPIMSGLKTIFGDNWTNLTKPRVVTGEAVADRTNTGLELALVFDTTLSMAEQVNGKSHIQYAVEAANGMLQTLYGDRLDSKGKVVERGREYLEHLYVSITPFNIAVNIGTENAHMLDATAAVPAYSSGFSWTGCVEARHGSGIRDTIDPSIATPYHLSDEGPVPAPFRRFYWPNTFDTTQTATGGQCTSNQDYDTDRSTGANDVCMGSNDWRAPSSAVGQNLFLKDANSYVATQLDGVDKTLSFGPNMMCPTTPILPLTRTRKTVEAHLAKMTDLPFAFGTMVPTGLQGGWYTLSPRFRKGTPTGGQGWTRIEPAPAASGPPLPALPLDYHTPNMRKFMVLLSDGDNNWPNARNITQSVRGTSSTYGNASKVVRPDNTRTELFYTAYGFLSNENANAATSRLGISVPNNGAPRTLNSYDLVVDYSSVRNAADGTDARLDVATRKLCDNIKKNDQISIIVVGYGIAAGSSGEAHRSLLKYCATSSDLYFETTDPTKLMGIFSKIGEQLSNLRLYQ